MAGPDWQALTSEWVDEGIIEAAQQDALLERLQRVPTSTGSSGFLDVVVMGLVMVGLLLIDSSCVVALALLDAPEEAAAATLAGIGLLQGVAGLGVRGFLHRAVGHGMVAAGVVAWCSGAFGFAMMERAFEPFAIVAVMGAFLVASVFAVADDARGVAGAAGFAILAPAWSQMSHSGIEILIGVLALGHILATHGMEVARHQVKIPGSWGALTVQAPFAATLSVSAIFVNRYRFFNSGSMGQAFQIAVLLGLLGLLTLAAGWAARSRFSIVSGVAVLLVAQLPVLWSFGDAIIGVSLLGLEGMGLVAAAILAVVVRQRQASGERAGRGWS